MRNFFDLLFKNKNTQSNFTPVEQGLLKEYNNHRPLGAKEKLCYAPFTNLYFGHHGKVVSCCYNRTHVLGIYPQNSIRDIWTGENAERLRKYISNNDLRLGCQSCNALMQAKNFDAIKAKMYDELPVNKKFPTVMEFELNNTCNLECVMCSGEFSSSILKNREKKPAMASAYDTAFVEQLEEFIPHLHETKFYGGEPFLIDIYYEIWEKIIAINPNCRISLQTNGTIFNNRVRDLLERGNFHIGVSIDSLQKENYEQIRVNANFNTVMENIKYFHEYCKKKDTFFGISACMMRQNWFEAPDFINFCNQLKIPVYFHSVFYPTDCAIWLWDSENILKIYNKLSEYEFPMTDALEQKNGNHFKGFVKQIHLWYLDAQIREEGERKILENNLTTLKTLLNEKIVAHINSIKDLSEQQKNDKINNCLTKLNSILNQLPEGELPPELMKKVLQYPAEIVINGLEMENADRLWEELQILVQASEEKAT